MPSYYSRLCRIEHLREAWKKISKSNRFSRGFDEQTIKQFGDNLEDCLKGIAGELSERKYEFQSARGVLIPKAGGGFRPLKIPAVRDRVVLKAVELLIAAKLRGYDLPCSFGYVPNRSVTHAISRIRLQNARGKKWILEADIKKFFDSVDQDRLLAEFNRKIRVRSLLPLIRQSLAVELGNPEDFTPDDIQLFPSPDTGIPQGGVLSPLFANFYLHKFDSAMTNAGFDLVRYADDFVVLCDTEPEAKSAYALCLKILEDDLGLRMHHIEDVDSKTRIQLYSKGFKFLGMQFQGTTVLPVTKKIESFRERIVKIFRPDNPSTLLETLTKTGNLVRGWANAYKICDDNPIFSELDDFVRGELRGLLQANFPALKGAGLSNKQLSFLGIPRIAELRARKEPKSRN